MSEAVLYSEFSMLLEKWGKLDINGPRGRVNINDKYNSLRALEFMGTTTNKKSVWKWVCDCGNITFNITPNIKNGGTKSCGCYQKESRYGRTTTHGMRHTPEYNIWCHVKGRCYNPNYKKNHYYGGRGIKMSDEWRDSFEAFYRDMGKRPDGLTSIERLDSDGDYNKDNCKWANVHTQVSNRRNNRYILYGGKIWTLAKMARYLTIDAGRLDYLLRSGYDIEEIGYRIEHKISFKKGRPKSRILVDRADIYIPYDKLKEMGYAIEE